MTRSEDPALDLRAMQAALGLEEPDDPPIDARRRAEYDAALAYWQERFAPLLDLGEPVAPSTILWQRIAADTVGAERPVALPDRPSLAERLWDSLGLWRLATAAALAAAILLALLGPFRPGSAPEPSLVAVLTSPGENKPGYLVEIASDRTVRLVPLGETAVPEGRALQFWTKADADPGPTSLGLVSGRRPSRVAFVGAAPAPGQLFEVTLEPAGGSTLGRPSGPILFVGRAAASEGGAKL